MSGFFKSKRQKKIVFIIFLALCLVTFFLAAFSKRRENINKYNLGVELFRNGDFQGAFDVFSDLGEYQDSRSYIDEARNHILFDEAILLYNSGKFKEALDRFSKVQNIGDFFGADQSQDYIKSINDLFQQEEDNEDPYTNALNYYDSGEYEEALKIFLTLGDYKDSLSRIQDCKDAISRQTRLKNATTISAGIRFSAGVTVDGKVAFAGRGYVGEQDIKEWTDIVSVAVNGEFVMGLRQDGTVVVANGASQYYANTDGWQDIIAVAAGQQYIVGLKGDGTVIAQGYNGYGEVDVNDWHDIIAISTGWQHTVGLDKDGDVFDENGNLYIAGYHSEEISNEIKANKDNWSNLTAIAIGGSSPKYRGSGHVVALKEDGSVIAAGDNTNGQCNVYGEEWKNIIAIAAGDFHTVGLKSDGTVVTTLEEYGDINSAAKAETDAKIVAISAGYGITLALTEDGKVVGVGYDQQGQLETLSWDKIAFYR